MKAPSCSVAELIARAAKEGLDRDDRTAIDPGTMARLRVELVALAAGRGTAEHAAAAMKGLRQAFKSGALVLVEHDNGARAIETLERYVVGALMVGTGRG